MDCAAFSTTCLLCWSDVEAAQYLYTLKTYEQKGDSLLQGKNSANSLNKKLLQEWGGDEQETHLGHSTEVLSSIRRITKKDAKNLMENYGSIQRIVECKDYADFIAIDGIGNAKVDSLLQCFKGPFDPNLKIHTKINPSQAESLSSSI